MHKLILKGGTAEREYALRDEAIIGRASESTIRLDNTKVDDRHAKVCRIGGNIFVEDLDSAQGISVNGRKVARWRLKKGDVIDVGGIQLLYDEDDKPEPPVVEPKPAATKSNANGAKVKSAVAPAVKAPVQASGTGAAPKSAPSKIVPAVQPPSQPAKTSISPAVQPPSGGPSKPAKPKTPPSGSERPNSLSRVGMPAAKPGPVGASSSRIPVPKMGISGIGTAVNPPGMTHSGVKLSQNSSASININNLNSPIAQASLAVSSARMKAVDLNSPPTEEAARTQKFLVYAIAALVILVLLMGGVLLVVLSRKTVQQSVVTEALNHMKAKGPKSPTDVAILNTNFMAIKFKAQVLDMLGEPDIDAKEKISLYEGPQLGSQDMLGPEFFAYHVNEQNVVEQGNLSDVLLFEIKGDRAFYMGVKTYCRIPVAPVIPPSQIDPNAPMPMPTPMPPPKH